MDSAAFVAHSLDADNRIWTTQLPAHLRLDAAGFDALWSLRPNRYHRIRMGGRWVDTPRWQQAYGADYRYTGHINRAQPVPASLQPYVDYVRGAVDPRLNGLLLNWYEAELGHYIGRHRDKPNDLIPGAPIVTISLGASRTFRLRPWKGRTKVDFSVVDGTVLVLPFETNQTWTHEVPLFAQDAGRRVSVTVRAFNRAQTTYRDQGPDSVRMPQDDPGVLKQARSTRDRT